ncbi:Rieske (2Fe-2S) protein [Bradyrhizobium sp. CCBAU 53415]|uniref:Rieske (2Fe-2S) protein n=1 Tax=Bradyrhizobium sp. CCBAU 53415 TaxID=1325119 RepID=UPI00230535A2|nr:hypothetical protein [Bradyrhizobium sp. CCBAU 53415]
MRTFGNDYFGYLNRCPRESVWLNIDSGAVCSAGRSFLRCGRHGARFEIDTGMCIDGACDGQSLEPVALAVIEGDVCLCGVKLLEDDRFVARTATNHGYHDPSGLTGLSLCCAQAA